jgi:hypothetical protein
VRGSSLLHHRPQKYTKPSPIMAMVPLPRDTGREPASLAEVPLDGGRYATLAVSLRHRTTSGTFPAKGGAKCMHCPVATHSLTCLPLWGGAAMPQGGGAPKGRRGQAKERRWMRWASKQPRIPHSLITRSPAPQGGQATQRFQLPPKGSLLQGVPTLWRQNGALL